MQCVGVPEVRSTEHDDYDGYKCKLRSVIHFLQGEGHSISDNHDRMNKVYGEKFMSGGSVPKWRRKFKERQTDFHNEGGQGSKYVATVDLVKHADQMDRDKRRFVISDHSEEFTEISKSALHTI